MEAEDGSGVSYLAPSLAVLDTHRLFFVEKYTGTVAYSRPYWTWFSASQTFAANAWREPVAFNLASDHGLAVTGSGGAVLSRPNATYTSPLTSPETDLTADVEGVELSLRRFAGRAKVTLRNDDGRFNDLASGDYSVIVPGAQVDVSPGYVSLAGNERSAGMKFWLDHWEWTSEAGRATLVLHLLGGWELVEGWRARRQYSWAAGGQSVSQLLRFVLGRAGLELLNVGGSSESGSLRPEFTINPGENGLSVVRRLLAMVPDVLVVAGEFVYLFEPEPADTVDYAYGTDHGIFRGRYADGGREVNRLQVFGDGVMSEEFDWFDVDDQLDRLRQVFDLNLDTAGKAGDRADTALRQELLARARGELVSAVNCGHEMYDVVSVTDDALGMSAEKFRVAGLELRYARERRPVYEQRLLLGGV
jgi:hypothetical protein